jgi:type I restriction enzyme R subunit
VFSSNGDGFVFHDRTGQSAAIEANLGLDVFPSPTDLWARYRAWKSLDPQAEQIVLQEYFDDGSGKAPRYYQVNAVNAAIEAIAKGRDRVLLGMATGTGKTYTAFQITWRLWKAGRKKRILFLADRNVLIDQTMVNDFRPFGAAMAKLSTNSKTIERQDGTTVDLTLALDKGRQRNDRRRNAVIAEEKGIWRGLVPRELPMSEVMSSPLPPSKTLEEQAAEILALIEEIISTAPEMEEQEEIPA